LAQDGIRAQTAQGSSGGLGAVAGGLAVFVGTGFANAQSSCRTVPRRTGREAINERE
jgi:hypothetical protein